MNRSNASKNGKIKNRPSQKEPKIYRYDQSNKLPRYGVIVKWDGKTKYNAMKEKLDAHMARVGPSSATPGQKSKNGQLNRKSMPYYRQAGLNKAIFIFSDIHQANAFADLKDDTLKAFIPMSFICSIGVAVFNKFTYKKSELQECFPKEYEVLQWRKKRLENGKLQVSISVRGSEIPDSLNCKGEKITFELLERKPIYCTRCLRYGHRASNCFRRPRCGVCTPYERESKHTEKYCPKIKRKPVNDERCLYCRQGHTIGKENCVEYGQQHDFRLKLVRRNLDYLTVLEKDILPAIRTTAVNSNRLWLD
ncbi:uncharacterized protein LOC134212530 [Armigeres subalbatus]|uniref:uncharacterized protein LOC134212530 n=1 Tax=Armigeres subalbatus TaxID=124917 RepID=UPI002ED0BFAA